MTLTKGHPGTRPLNYLMLESSTSSELLCSVLDTFSWPYLPLVASVGPEALRVLHEYISGDTPESVLDNSPRQAALDDGVESVNGDYAFRITRPGSVTINIKIF